MCEIAHRPDAFGVRRPGTGGKAGEKVFGEGDGLFRLIDASAKERLGVAPFAELGRRGSFGLRFPKSVGRIEFPAGPQGSREPTRRPGIGFACVERASQGGHVFGRRRLEKIPFGVDPRREAVCLGYERILMNPRDAARQHRTVRGLRVVGERHGLFEKTLCRASVAAAKRHVGEARVGEGPRGIDCEGFAVGGFGLRERAPLQKCVPAVVREPVAPLRNGVAPAFRARVVGLFAQETFERRDAFGARGALVDAFERPFERFFKGFVGKTALGALRDEKRRRPAKGFQERLSFGASRLGPKQHVGVFELERRLGRDALIELFRLAGGLVVASRDGEKAQGGVALGKIAPGHALERAGVAAGPRVGRSAEFLEKRGDLRLVLPSGDVVAKEVAQIVKLQLRVVGRHAEEPSERIAFHGRVVGRSRRFDLACEPARLNPRSVRGAERVGRRERGKDR